MRDWLLFFHIVGAAGWIGGGLFAWFTYTQIAKNAATSGKSLATLTGRADRYFGPVAVLTLLSGIALVWTQDPWQWNDTFVLMGIGVFVFSAVFQPLVSSKAEKRLLEAVESGGDTTGALRSSNLASAVDIAVVLVTLWAMVVKLGA
ncbi:MAG TPA: DUF2269 family protein [Acidimicrobiia bacterium]